MTGDWTAYDEERDARRCANGQWLGFLALVLPFWAAMLLCFIVTWVLACP